MHGWKAVAVRLSAAICLGFLIGDPTARGQEFVEILRLAERDDYGVRLAERDDYGGGIADGYTAGGGHCNRRRTLMQWSYGTSFGGGAPLDEPLVTDRPDFTEASSTVGRGVAQLEFGYTYFHDASGGESTTEHSIGEPLLRYGFLADWLEFRIAANYLREVRRSQAAGRLSDGGASDLYLGLKIALTPQEGILPEMALIPQMLVPTGTAPFSDRAVPPGEVVPSSDRVLPGLNWLYSWQLTDRLSLAGSTQFNLDVDPATDNRYTQFAQSVSLGFAFTQRLGGYVEWYALMPSGADQVKPEYYLNGGPVWLVTDDLQLDLRAGLGLNEVSGDYFLGAGASVRF